jgi:hypothetical protein
MTSTERKKWTDISTITSAMITAVGVIVSAIAIVMGSSQFQKSQAAADESRAVDLFIKYEEVMKERDASGASYNSPSNRWRGYLAIGIAEAIFKLQKGEKGWTKTVRGMVADHKEFLTTQGLDCDTFIVDFVELVNEVVETNVCAELKPNSSNSPKPPPN